MRRHRDELVKLGATVSDQGHWSIPVPALITAGLMDRRTPPDALVGVTTPTVTPDYLERIALLERQLQEEIMARKDEHAGRVLAEQIAAERERIIQAQAQTLRILEAGTVARNTADRDVAADQDVDEHQDDRRDDTVEGTLTGRHAAEPVAASTGRPEVPSAVVDEGPSVSRPRGFRGWFRRAG